MASNSVQPPASSRQRFLLVEIQHRHIVPLTP